MSAPKLARRNAARTLKVSLKDYKIPSGSWEQVAEWRALIGKGADDYKAKRIGIAEQKREKSKAGV